MGQRSIEAEDHRVPEEEAPTQDADSREPPADLRGRRFGDFEIMSKLGAGGMGEVYLARQVSLSRQVALKLLSPALASSAGALDRFLREAKIAASLDHPAIVGVLASGIADGRPWIAMRLVRGVSLAEVLREGEALEVEAALAVACKVARALQAAHDAGIIHRDVKPGNVLIESGARDLSPAAVYLADFGLASLGDGTTLTYSGEILGTPAYMSPEQASGERLDARSDIYSLGATLYAMLSGHAPFEATRYLAVLHHVKTRDPVPLRKRHPGIDRDAAVICEKAMRWDRRARYASAGEFADDIENRLARRPIRARPPSIRYRASLWVRRNPRVVAAAAIVFLLGAAGFFAERAWRREQGFTRAAMLCASGEDQEALEVSSSIPSLLPWPFRDGPKMSLLMDCSIMSGDLAGAVKSARGLPAASRGEAFKALEDLLTRQTLAARLLAESGAWWSSLKVLWEVLKGLEAYGGDQEHAEERT